ncbi:hypothetical protein GYMLUDRAFT_41222 [Collybiopsis luxurians FD-317 M1]|uniref:Uncharacterized protein n=1 Tax=Collybiopsis luxurians FD-317 M1 TaxID=944289 RepID=A0A0D0C470_9AGAR|nr:hypothetical protein GYMLUDRAFT_41222 [Collybiopsis luxurians FD-317 M1]
MKFTLILFSFLLSFLTFNVNAWHFGIGLNEEAACSCPFNCFSKENDACKYWADDKHIYDGTCQKNSGFHLIHQFKCTNGKSVDVDTYAAEHGMKKNGS